MLEVKNLKKTYHSKTGVSLTALNGINLRFEDKGLVFVLGKSGSGKSTFLNVVSGLDSFDSGEIKICDKSTNDFSQKDYDAYRNTYIGFIFQEYNILGEFTVKENIALALDLQGAKVEDSKIEKLLAVVGLEGLKDRKPNELSGGQKQRVAIARALIKDPEIIFADEPTGNLDSSSGVQVFDFLKELSKTKLIILVSHDREAAYKYGDRIIELSDGKVILDVSRKNTNTEKKTENFSDTKKILVNKKRSCALINSKLPTKISWKIALNNIGVKKGRLIVTILLIVLAISMFGFTEILAQYDMVDSSVSSFNRSDINNVIIRQGKIGDYFDYFERSNNPVTEERITHLNELYPETNFSEFYPLRGVVLPLVGGSFLPNNIRGALVSSAEGLESMGYKMLGDYPESGSGKIVISDFMIFVCLSRNPDLLGISMADFFKIFTNMEFDQSIEEQRSAYALVQLIVLEMLQSGKGGNDLFSSIIKLLGSTEEEMSKQEKQKNIRLFEIIWEKLLLSVIKTTNQLKTNYTFTFSGVFITGFEKYLDFLQMSGEEQLEDERAVELAYLLQNFYSLIYVSDTFLDSWYNQKVRMGNYIVDRRITSDNNDLLNNIDVKYNSKWLENNPEMSLADDEIIISDVLFHDIFGGLATFETDLEGATYNPENTNYQYIYKYTPSNDRLKAVGEELTLKVVGIFDFYKSLRQNYDDDSDNNVLIENVPRYIVASDFVLNEAAEVMKHCGALYFRLPQSEYEKTKMLKYICNTEEGGLLMYHHTSISDMIYAMNDMIFVFQKVFQYLSYIMGAFSILLLANFMTTSVMNKKRDIGILRALGARGKDVSKIFLNEASVIGAITTFFSCIGMIILTMVVNYTLRESFLRMFKNQAVNNLTMLTLTFMPFLIVIIMSALLVYMSTIIPVRKISRMLPVNAIKKA